MNELIEKASKLKKSAKQMGMLSVEEKNHALLIMADHLLNKKEWLIAENAKDIEAGKANGLSGSLLDRLLLTEERIEQIVDGVRQLINLEDPIGETIEAWARPNGLQIETIRVPLGV